MSKVSTAKPKIAGAIYVAPAGTVLPTDATSTIPEAFKPMGFCSDDGMTNTTDMSATTHKAWGKYVVLVTQDSKDDGFKFTLIEYANLAVLKHTYGDNNVSGTLDTGIKIKASGDELDAHAYIIDLLLADDVIKRICIPEATVTAIGDIKYTDSDLIGYETTLACVADDEGGYHYEYIQKKAS